MISPRKLVNEWRDTILLTTSVAAAAAWPAHAVEIVLTPIFWREALREWAWLMPATATAGVGCKRPNSNRVRSACGLLAVLLLVLDLIARGYSRWLLLIVLGVILPVRLILVASHCGSLRSAADAYLSVWDWPRKRDGGGETSKLQQMIDMARPAAAGGAA